MSCPNCNQPHFDGRQCRYCLVCFSCGDGGL
jgi:hypothetical protein